VVREPDFAVDRQNQPIFIAATSDAARHPRDEKTKTPTHCCHRELTTRRLLISNPLRLGRPLRLCDKIEAISTTYRSNPAIFIAAKSHLLGHAVPDMDVIFFGAPALTNFAMRGAIAARTLSLRS